MTVFFDYTDAEVFSLVKRAGGGAYTGPYHTDPSSAVFWQAAFNPGHAGVTTLLEYWFSLAFTFTPTAPAAAVDMTVKLQYRTPGGAWTDLESRVVSFPITSTTAVAYNPNGIFTTAITLPIELRIIGTAVGLTCRIDSPAWGQTGAYYMRAIGTVA